MSIFGPVLNSATKALAANQYALAVASNNIANANNPDYTRQRLITRPSATTEPWHIGTGVDVVGVQALRDRLLEARYRNTLSNQSGAGMQSGRLGEIEALFNDSNGTGLSQAISGFFNSFHDLAQDPASLTNREQVKMRAGSLIDAIHQKDLEFRQASASANTAIAADVQQINRLSSEIAGLTAQIKAEEATGPAHDLRDRRGALVNELSKYVAVRELDSGDYQLSMNDGHVLVMNGSAQRLSPDAIPAGAGGSLQAELEIRDSYVPKYSAALDQLAYEIAEKVNGIHSASYDLDGNTNVNLFTPLTSVSGAARSISLSAEVAANSRKIAASNLPSGNDNGAATAIANLLSAPVFSAGSVIEQYSSLVFWIGSDASEANANESEQNAMLTQLENRRQSMSGVSIDEEAVQISQFQRAYEASAQLVSIVDELIQVTLGMVGS